MDTMNTLNAMKEETLCHIKNATDCDRPDAATAWYWTHVGALDAAYQFGLITDKERQTLFDEFRQSVSGGENDVP